MPTHRMKLSWRRKKGSITSGKRDREDRGGTAEEAKSRGNEWESGAVEEVDWK